MESKCVTIVNQLGLHARAAARFVERASQYECEVQLRRGTRKVNGKSIMGVMMLAAACGMQIEVLTDGIDERAAVVALSKLVEQGFGEK